MIYKKFIIVDDDPLNNKICAYHIKGVAPEGSEILSFTEPEEALLHISESYNSAKPEPTLLLLDINMPNISGWDFLDIFNNYDQQIREQFSIYILSSSVDTRDKQRAEENIHVADFWEKPLDEKKIMEVL